MPEDSFRYDILAQDALRGVVRAVLRRVEKRGLPGDHHFVITFATRAPGVALSKRLIERYPEFMTIVIQYQFWGLKVYENAFELGLSFNNVPETLVIPFRAMKRFHDPSVGFMLQFGPPDPLDASETDDSAFEPADHADRTEMARLPGHGEPALPAPTDSETAPTGDEAAAARETREDAKSWQDNTSADGKKGADVVHLDAFRKK